MTWNEVILIIGVVTILFFTSELIRKKLKPKTRLIVSLISFIILMTWFIISGANDHFSTIQLVVLIVFAVAWVISFYYRYKKYQQANQQNK